MSASASSPRKSAPAKSTAKKSRAKTKAKTAKAKKADKAVPKTVTPAVPVEVVVPTPKAAAAPIEVQPPAAEVTDEQISQRAYEIWIEKGRPYGQEQANWDQAVAELRG